MQISYWRALRQGSHLSTQTARFWLVAINLSCFWLAIRLTCEKHIIDSPPRALTAFFCYSPYAAPFCGPHQLIVCLFCHLDQCNSALGMGNFKIPPRSLLASREIVYWPDDNGRINNTVSGWCAGVISDKEWFQIQFDTDHYVTAVANQATPKGFVLEFTVAYSRGIGWFDYMENGTIKVHLTDVLGSSRNLRFRWRGKITWRVTEPKGCTVEALVSDHHGNSKKWS